MTQPTLLEVSGVSVSFDGFKAINNLSFQIGPAEMRAIIGPNGAGKTTFMDIVTGKKSILDYLLKPLLRARDNALRER